MTKEGFAEILCEKMKEKGFDVKKNQAWELFKAGWAAIVEAAKKEEVSLSGIGTFSIKRAKPRVTRFSKDVANRPEKNRLKIRVSSAIQSSLN